MKREAFHRQHHREGLYKMPIPRGYPSSGYKPSADAYQEAFYTAPHSDLARGMSPPPQTYSAPAGPLAEPATPYTDPTFKGSVPQGPLQVAPTNSGVPQISRPADSSVTPASAAAALAKYAARLNPVARALLLGVDIGNWLYDNRLSLSAPGWSLGGDWTKIRTDATSLPSGSATWTEFVWWFNTDHGTNSGFYSRAAIEALNGTLNGTGPDTYIREWAIWIEPGEPWQSMDPTVFNFETGAFWQGTTTPVITEGSPSWVPDYVDTRVPYKAIPKQKEWDHPLTDRGNSVAPKLSPLQKTAYDAFPGNTYYVNVPPSGPVTGGAEIPPSRNDGVTEYSQPPNDRVRERKVTLRGGAGAMRLFGKFTEFSEFVTCLFKSVPLKQRLKDGVTKRIPKGKTKDFLTAQGEVKTRRYVDVGVYKQAQYLYTRLNDVNIAEAIDCWRSSEATDAVIGKYSSAANNATVKNPFWVSPKGIGGGFGP